MNKLIETLFGLFLVTFPFSVRFLVYEDAAYRFGKFNPWVAEFIYLPEVLLLVTFGLFAYPKVAKFFKKHKKVDFQKTVHAHPLWALLAAFALNALIITAIRGDIVLGLFFVLRLAELAMFYVLLEAHVLRPKTMIHLLMAGAGFQVLLAWGQYAMNQSLGLSWFGEQTLSPITKNVAKIDLPEGGKHIRGYGTFLHPNILASYLLLVFFVAIPYLKFKWRELAFAVLMIGLYVTQSHAALILGLIGIGLAITFNFAHRIKVREAFGLFLVFILGLANTWLFFWSDSLSSSDASLQERLVQNQISHDMFFANPLGVGVRNFTLQMEQFIDVKLMPWEFQPVHNTYFLLLNETGFQGLLLLIAVLTILLYKYWNKGLAIPLFMIMFLAPFDHFLLDSFAGMMLVGMVFGFFMIRNRS